MTATSPPQYCHPQVIDQRFEIRGVLGRGASATVLEAADRHEGDQVRALKILSAGADEGLLRAEFGRLSQLDHANLVTVHGLGRLDVEVRAEGRLLPQGSLYLVLDAVRGQPPAARLAATPVEARDELLRSIAEDLAGALEELHGQGLVHHDVKPANVLVDAEGRAVLIDLGLATRAGTELRARGTLAYMAPEALEGGGDLRVDLYGLGATLFELAEGQPPFTEQGPGLLRAILERPAPLLRGSWLRQETAALVERLLAKAPLQRPRSARSVRAALARIRGHHDRAAQLSGSEPILAPAFCGRGSQAAELLRILNGDEVPAVIAISGAPGSGKSRLLAEALRRQRLLYAAGRGPALEVVEGDPRALLDADEGVEKLDDAAVAILHELERRGERRRQLVVLQLEDPLAQRLACFALRGDVAGALFVCEVTPASKELSLLHQQGGDLALVEVPPLDGVAAAQLLVSMLGEDRVSASLADELYAISAGHPAVLIEAGLAWARGEELEALAASGGALKALLAGRRRALDIEGARIVDALAVWGRPSSRKDLAALTGKELPWHSVVALARDGLLQVLQSGALALASTSHYRAWQAAVPEAERLTLLERAAKLSTDSIRRGELHCEALELAGPGAPVAAAARAAMVAAAEQLEARHELPRARRILETVVARAGADGDVSTALVKLHVATGAYGAALRLLEQEAKEPSLLRAEALQRSGDYQGAREELEAILRTTTSSEPQARVLLGRLLLRRGEPQGALEACAEAAAAAKAKALGGEALSPEEAGSLEVGGLARFYLGDLGGAQGLFEAGAAGLGSSPRVALRARFRSMLGMVSFTRGELSVAASHYQGAIDGAAQAGAIHATATYRGNLGSACLELGEYQVALTQLSRAARDLARLARNTELASVLHNLGGLMLLLGDLSRVEDLWRRAGALARELESRHVSAYVELLAAELARRRGEPSAALECFGRALKAFRELNAPREVLLAQLASVEMLVHLGRLERAAQLLSEAEELWRSQSGVEGATEAAGQIAQAWGRLLARLSEASAEQVRTTCDELVRYCADLEARGAMSKLWRGATVLGTLLASKGRRGAGVATLRRARGLREQLMAKAPDHYRDSMREDPDARGLEAQWQALVDAGESSPGGPAPDSRPGWLPDEHRLRRLLAINKRLNSEHRLPNLLEMIVDTVIELTDAERGFLILVEERLEGDATLSIKLARNIDRRSLEEGELTLSRSIAEKAARSGQPVVTFDALDDERFRGALSVSDLSLRSVLAVPLRVKGRVVGTIYVDHRLRRGAFGESEVALVQDFADQAAIAIDNARLLAENDARRREIEDLNASLESRVEQQAAELAEVREELRSSKQAAALRYNYQNIIGRTPRMVELFSLLDRVTDTELPVVVQGESGTGKELVARAIHYNGPRQEQAFVSENCGAIPETLLESVLFGAVRGAYTGATRDRRGLFEVAHEGTLFLDEVGEMSPSMQTKLLRVLQDGELRRVGGENAIRVDVRIIAASNRDLRKMVEAGSFREDLYYRLNVIRVEIPALRERREDIPLLIAHFLDKHARVGGQEVAPEALAKLMGYPWPGNVRELENEIMRMAALAGARVGLEDLSPQIRGGAPLSLADGDDLRLKPRMEHLERELIDRALERTDGNQSRAAKLLGLSRYGLLKKLKRLYPERYET